MSTLNVSVSQNFSAQTLLGVTLIDFTNTLRGAIATFAATQFDDTHISTTLAVSGSASGNTLRVVGSAIYPNWSFTNWSANDRVELIGTTGDDSIMNASVACLIDGGAGNDTLQNYFGNHTIMGGEGDDLIESADGVVDGGAGLDRWYGHFGSETQSLHVDLTGGGLGLDIGTGMTVAGIERADLYFGSGNDGFIGGGRGDYVEGNVGEDTLNGKGGSDTLYGMEGNDLLLGSGGNDSVSGLQGADTVKGGLGNDTVSGGDGDDELYGDDGADVVWGGLGHDRLTGGAGADRFAFFTPSETGMGALRDVITDFQQGQDRIDLGHIGDGQFQFIGATSFYGPDMEVRVFQTATDTIVQGCIDPSFHPDQVFEIRLNGLFTLTLADFIL